MGIARDVATSVVAISSMDVCRAWGVLHVFEPGPLETLPLREDSSLRTTHQLSARNLTYDAKRIFVARRALR
jgi:hypothetical protein